MAKHKLVFDSTDAQTIAASDSVGAFIRSSDGTQITHTTIGSDEALDVNIANTSVTVDATDLDIRDLSASQDNVAISDGTDTMAVNADGSINSVVTATDLDIRDLTAASDSVQANLFDGSGTAITSTGGALDVNIKTSDITIDVDLQAGAEFAEDSAHTTGDIGNHVLAVRQDTLASSVDADGDYASLKVNAVGEVYVKDSDVLNALQTGITVTDAALADTAILAAAEDVTTTSGALLTAGALANRKYLSVYNNGNKDVFIGQSGVTTANGFPVFPGSILDLRVGASVAVHAVALAGTQEVRALELS